MARNLKNWQRQSIVHMTRSRKRLTISQMAKVAKCSERSVTNIRRNLRLFGSPRSPSVPAGQPSSITSVMLDALCDHLAEKPGLYIDEMAIFLWDEFNILPSPSSVKRALTRAGWTRKKIQQKAREQNTQLRDFYQHKLSEYRSYHLVFVDESGCDKRVGYRRTGWSPLGVTPVQVSKFHRGQRYQILPAYTQDGVILSRIFKGSTDAVFFESFIKQLLQHCGKWPEPKSVLVMGNASFHHSDRIKQLCSDAGVKLLYLPPYSPDFNPIEEFFAELKAYIKKSWSAYEANPEQGFHIFLRRCVHDVGAKQQSAEGHFRHAGITIERA
jgi:transposase